MMTSRVIPVEPFTRFEARFAFQMPILQPADYTITVGLANGTQTDHVIHHWMHDALAFRSTASSLRAGGLVGLPMAAISLVRLGAMPPIEVIEPRRNDQHAHV